MTIRHMNLPGKTDIVSGFYCKIGMENLDWKNKE